jgi:hypothetical protein
VPVQTLLDHIEEGDTLDQVVEDCSLRECDTGINLSSDYNVDVFKWVGWPEIAMSKLLVPGGEGGRRRRDDDDRRERQRLPRLRHGVRARRRWNRSGS